MGKRGKAPSPTAEWPVPAGAVASTASLLAYLAAHDSRLGTSHRPLRAGLSAALRDAAGEAVHARVLEAVEELTAHATSPAGSSAGSS